MPEQKRALMDLLESLKDFDLCLYTGHDIAEVPDGILKYLKYIKYGPFVKRLKTTIKPFVGSENQVFMEVKRNEEAK